MRNGVIRQVGMSGHHTAAQGTAENPHVRRIKPPVGWSVVVLNVESGGEAVEAPDSKEAIIDYLNAKVAAAGQHRGHEVPRIGLRVVSLSGAQTSVSIKATNLKVNAWVKWLWSIYVFSCLHSSFAFISKRSFEFQSFLQQVSTRIRSLHSADNNFFIFE